ncbi:hypothetical protein O181_103114 [Austropuccinia psidii MF-1]|uniref:Uncharacterized protein n=1 Tax=Austropuccinia psidii MF-1 TaxID=1389203 RepID=A0A9Q3JJU6_9BASI|nr:hypothetical protein [Austropuccinia psidii MF-1]
MGVLASRAFLGHLDPLPLLRPMGRDSRYVGHLGPFWPNPMWPKGTKGAIHLGPKARWVPNHNIGPTCANFGHQLLGPKSDQKPHGHHFGHKSHRTQFWPWTTMDQ